ALARIGGRLEEEHVAADSREREARCDASLRSALAYLALETPRAEPTPHAPLVDPQRLRLRLPLGDLTRSFAQHVREAALEVADAGLARVLADDQTQRLVGDGDLVCLETVRLDLLRHEVALGDPELLVLRVAGELNHVHAVEQRAGNRVEVVGRAD